MPLDKGKLQKLYSTLQQGGYTQSYDEFEKGFTGNDNYPNRKKVYDLLTEHGADIGNSYEDFMKKMYTPAASSPAPSYSQQRTQAPAPKPQPKPAPKPKPRPKSKGGGMTAAQRAQFIRNAQDIVHQSAAGLQRVKNQMDYANGNRGLKVRPVHLGQNSKVVRRHANGTVAKPRPVFDVAPEQQPGDTYLTESGNEFTSRADADTEQNAVDQYRYDQSETGQLNNAYAEAERLDQLLEQRGKELDAENEDKWWRDLPRGGGGAVSTMNANDNNGRMTDTEYLNLLAARKKVDEQIRDLKAARDEKTGTFLGGLWRGFRDYAFDPSNWDNGYRDLLTTSAMLRAKTGAAQTKREKASERMMMEDTYKAGVAAQKAEEALGNGYRWARITAQALPYGLQLMAGNAIGVTGGLARAGEGMGVKLARKIAIKEGANNMIRNFGRSVLKNTGVMLGDLGAAAALSTTVQAAQTGADIGKRYAGDVVYDPKTDDYKLEGGKSLGRSIYEGVANSTIENYTEMLGEHMHLGKFASSALTKVGLGRVSNWFTKVGKTDFMQGVNKYMKMAGFNGYPQEVMEEEVGIPLHAVFDGGNKMSDLLDGRQQLDIVGGMLFSMAGMGGASMVMQGGHKAAMAVQYHQDQHKLDNADKIASFRLTADKWAPIKEEIDGTTNEDFGKTMKNVLSNDELSDQEKQAVWDYAQRLIIMRGHNMGQEAATRNGMTDKETNAANESYTQGYNTTDATAMNDAKNRLAAAQQKLDGIFGENTNAQQILDAKKEDGSPYFTANDRKAAQAVVNAQQEYEGMMQRVRDDIDDEVQQTGAIYDSRTNDQGVIQSATLKAQNPDGTDKKVYITSGNVVMTDDGKSVDNQKSDMSIVVVDEDGKVQMISPDELFSLDTPIDGAQAKQQAIDAIQQSKAQEAADKINGKVNLTAGSTYTLTDNTGQQIEATIVADGQTGAVQNPDGTVNVSMNGKVVPMDVNTLQQMVDNTNMQRTAQSDEEDTAEEAAAQQQPTEPDNTEQTGDEGGAVTPEGGGTVSPDDEGNGVVPSYPGDVVAPDVQEPHQWQVDDTFTIDNGGMPVRGQVTGIDADGVEIYTESPVNGKKMQVVTPEELQSMTTEVNGETVQTTQDEAAAEQQPTQPSPTEQSGVNGVNGSNGVNGEQAQEQAQPQQTEGQPARAIDRIPSQQVDDGKGNVRTVHNWEQAEPGDTYDALTEIYHGNADRVKKGIDNRVGKIDKAIKGVQKQMDSIDNSDDFDEVAAQSEQYDQLQQQKDDLEKQKKYWQGVQMVPRNRKMDSDRRSAEEQAAAKAAQEKAEAEAAEKARQEREQVNGVPDVVNDIPADARKRGFRNVNGMVVNRQGETQGVTGRESNVKFSSTDTAKGHIKVIDADQLQPSHVSGQRNPSFFIDEAQPKDRTDTVSSMAAAKIASNLNPEEITGDGSAYQFSAPTVNSRGEVIQGNNRSDALKLMYSNPAFKPAQDAYKQYISDHAEEFGFTPEDVAKIQQMQHPVMVNELSVDDDEAIRLGQMRASDNESGGIERIDPVTTSQKLGAKVGSYANILLSSPDEDASLSDVLMQNGAKTVHWLSSNGIISNTAAQSAFDRKGNLTPEARMDLLNILKQSLFQGGVSDLPTMFDKLPAKAQKAILNTFMRDFDSAESERILPEIQKAIEAWYGCAMSNEAFAKAPNYKAAKAAMHDWTLQTNLLDDNMPSDKFSNFAMELACRFQGCSMRETQQSLNDFFDLVQGKSQGDLFGGTTLGEQADRKEAIKRIFNIEYKPINNNVNGENRSNAVADDNSQSGEGRPGSTGDGADRERAAGAEQHADVAGGAEGNDEKGINAGAIRTKDGGYKKLPTGYAYRITDAQEVQDVINNGMFRKMPDDMIVPGSNKVHTSKSGRKFSLGKQAGNTHGGKAFAAGMPWGDNGNGGTTSGGHGEKYFIAIPGNNIDGWRVGHHGHYSEPRPFDEIEEGKGLWLPFDEDGDVADLSTDGMRVFKKVGDTYYEVEHPEDIANNATQQTAQPIGSTSSPEHVKTEREAVNTEPTEKQKEAGNYKKGHIKVDGFDITIENPKGSTRSGKDASGKAWSVPMHYDYGYIKGTEGVDGDHIDVYLSDNPTSGNVYVVDQIDQKTGNFDEHKVMYGFPSMEAAVEAYKGQYTDGWKVGTVTEVSREDFKKWVESSKRKTKPFSEYKSMKEAAAMQQPTQQSGFLALERRGTEHEALPTLKEPAVYKNNLAGGDAYVNIEGNPKSGYEVRYYDNKQDADINYPLAIGTEYMTAEQLADHLQKGDFTIAEQPTEPSTPTGTNGANGGKGKEKKSKALGVTVQVKANLEEAEDSPHNDEPSTPSEAEEGGVLYREVDDEEAARLDNEPTVKVYRAMQEHDGKLYPPMSGRVKTQVETKKGTMRTKWVWRSPIEIGKWEQSEEHPEMANEDGTFTLDKGNGSTINAAYNPYIHTSRTPINDQFSSAWNRPELVTVEVEVPVSELTSGYHAEKAKDSTGEVEWKSGPVGREMAAQGKPRMVILSRWDKPVRIVPVDEVADEYAVRLAGTGIKVPFNTVPPALRDALVARGVEISEPEKGNAGQASRPSYEEWLRGNQRQREGNGTYSDEELSLMNDPVAKWLGKSNRTKAQQKAFANRERKSMETAVRELAERLHLDNVNIVMDASTLEGRKARAKGFYDRNTGQITIVIPNHRDVDDVMQTLLHEGVAHYGLRQLFGKHFDTFLDNVYAAADNDVRRRITDLALRKYKGDFRVATEEYLASLAENTDFERMPETFWSKIKSLFLDMLHAIGFDNFASKGVTLSDNELRYILWRSYENLKEPGRYRSILGEAEDIDMQERLGVGNYADEKAERDLRHAYNNLDETEYNYQNYEAKKKSDPFRYNPKQAARLKEMVDYWKDKIAELEKKSEPLDPEEAIEEARKEREENIQRITPRIVDTFKKWLNVRRTWEKAVDTNADNALELGDELNNMNDMMDAAMDAAFDYGIDVEKLLRDNGYKDDDLKEWLHMFGNSASEPTAWGKRDMLSKAEQVSHGIDPDLLFRDTIEDDDNTARETYNRMADEARSRLREAWQDSMINVRNLQQAVLEQRGEKLEDYEDAYNAENRSHGKSRAESEYFTDNLYKPLLKAVDDVAKAAKVSVGDVTEYMMAKHGLERNIVFARRDAASACKKAYHEAKGKYDALMNASWDESDPKKADALKKAANKVKFPDYDDIFNHLRMRDYAGLTSLTGQSDVQDAEAEAQRIVADMESRAINGANGTNGVNVGSPIDELWKATNAATKWTLKKGYESGIISKNNYNYVSGMFNYYVPLRGWQEDTAGDLFDYVGSGDKGTAFSPTLHKAKGRRSEADNPIAYIGSMAVSAIVQGNKNKVKQTFLGFVENHPTNLVTVSEMWYRNFGTDTDPDWREDVPNIPEDATADEVADIVQQHEDLMEQLKDLGKATKKRGRLHLGVPVKKGQALEHHVEVMVNGKKYVLYINGNPRAAQALNGTRQRRASERSFESSKIARMGRLLAERYTSLSPSFTVSNALRDLTMAAITTLIKESPAYAMRFRLNVLKLGGPARMFTLMKWYKKAAAQQLPTGQMDETEKYFYEFMTEGAETGFTSLKEIDEYKKDMDKMYRNMNQKLLNPKRLFRGLSKGLEYANRCIEDMTRFAIYMASRQSGRNVKRSVNDAKNITLNFNRKGSGELGNATYRNLQIFVNPAIQSLQNVGKMAKDHPVRFSLLTGSIALIGAAQVFATQLLWSVFGGGDGDDDDWNAVDEYWKLPSWQRRNNLVMWIPGTKKFAMIPLAQEFRVFHGFGETLTTTLQGKSDENPALELMSQTADLLPLDFAGNNGNMLVNLAPTVTQPLLQVRFNTDFTGRPLYKDNSFNKYEPSFQKAYVGTPSWLVKSSEFLNDLTGGDAHKQGWWERTNIGQYANNPAVVDHLLKGYLGGMYSFLAQTVGAMITAASGKVPDVQEVPIANRVVTAVRETEQSGKQKLPDWYYELSEENARQQNEFSGYKKDYMKGDADGQKKFNELINSKDFQKWQEVNTYIGAVQQIRTAMNYTKDPNEKAELQKNLDEVLGELKKMKDE